jgi:glutamate racemase
MIKTAVIAGTSVDTRMGVEYIEKRNEEAGSRICEPVYLPVAEDCDAQVRFQYSDTDGKRAVIDAIFDRAIENGIRDFFIYCNSLSGAFDFDTYAVRKSLDAGEDIRIYTPLQVYRELGASYSRIGVMAANNLSAHGIEEALMSANPGIYAIGTGNMSIVRAIEDGLSPEDIAVKCGLSDMLNYMEACGAEAVLLGCTHFPYLKEVLSRLTDLPLIDPADNMFDSLVSKAF